MEHAHPVHHGYGHELISELGKKCGESEEEGLPTGGSFRAYGQVTLLQELLDHGGVCGAVTAESDGLDRGDDLGEAGDGVGDSRDWAAERSGEEDWVEEGPVGADEEDTRFMRVGFSDRWWWCAFDDDADTKCPKGVIDYLHGEE